MESVGRTPIRELWDDAFDDAKDTSVCESPPGSTPSLQEEMSPLVSPEAPASCGPVLKT